MARIRSVKPELWTDPEFTECSLSARLLFIAMLNFASDYGVLPDKPRQLKMQCLPADTIEVDPLIDELVAQRFLERHRAPNGEKVLVIRTFTKNQKINRATLGRWGDPSKWGKSQQQVETDSVSTHGGLTEPHPSDGKGRDYSERDSSDLHSSTCSTGADLTADQKKKCNTILEFIVDRRIDGKPTGASYRATTTRDVKANYAGKIAALVRQFPDAPVDSIAHGAETGDTRRLAHYAPVELEPDPDEPKLSPEAVKALITPTEEP